MPVSAVVDNLSLYRINKRHQGKIKLRVLKEHLSFSIRTIIFPKYTPLFDPLNKVTEGLWEAGIIQYHLQLAFHQTTDTERSGPKQLELTELGQGFALVSACLMTALLVFVLELVAPFVIRGFFVVKKVLKHQLVTRTIEIFYGLHARH